MKKLIIAFCILAARSAEAQQQLHGGEQVYWNQSTQYQDGSPIPPTITINYNVYIDNVVVSTGPCQNPSQIAQCSIPGPSQMFTPGNHTLILGSFDVAKPTQEGKTQPISLIGINPSTPLVPAPPGAVIVSSPVPPLVLTVSGDI